MNAPANIRSPKRDMYIPHVQAFRPQSEGEDLSIRCSLLLVRDQAAKGLLRCSDEAAGVLEHVQRLAGLYAFATLPLPVLSDLRAQLIRLISCATGLELVAWRMAHPNEEGAHEGG